MSKGNVLIHVSGSISCFKTCTLVSLLIKAGYCVQTTASQAALHFIGKATLEGLTGRPVLTDLFGGVPDVTPHITLAQKWADLILAYPASANLLNRLAAGLCDDLFGSICLANNFKKPLLLAPAMNSEMFAHPSVRLSIQRLQDWGAVVLPTEEGRLACGTVGKGRLIAPEFVFEQIERDICIS
jgi:phosphopantothenoylcysteine decarboxylase/phosphopantothenate--cysteine ligase